MLLATRSASQRDVKRADVVISMQNEHGVDVPLATPVHHSVQRIS